MKVLFYNHTGRVCGAEKVLFSLLASAVRGKEFAAVLCSPATGEFTHFADLHGIPFEPLEELHARFTWRPDHLLRFLFSFYRVITAFRAQVREHRPDLIHANSIRAGLVATAATLRSNIPVVWHVHDALPRHPLSTLIRCFALATPRTHLLGVSRSVIRRFESVTLETVFGRSPFKVIHNGIDVARFDMPAAAGAVVREELGLMPDDIVACTIGQLAPRKGQLELIRAFAHLADRRVKLLIIGSAVFDHDHDYARTLQAAVAEYGLEDRVLLLGSRSDLPALLQAVDLVVLNSHSDPFPLVLLEAMAAGKPVLATAVDGIPEMIDHKESGWLIPPGHQRLLVEALDLLLATPSLRADLATLASIRVRSHFRREDFTREVEVYLSALVDSGIGRRNGFTGNPYSPGATQKDPQRESDNGEKELEDEIENRTCA